jgi:hypothetical protein
MSRRTALVAVVALVLTGSLSAWALEEDRNGLASGLDLQPTGKRQ